MLLYSRGGIWYIIIYIVHYIIHSSRTLLYYCCRRLLYIYIYIYGVLYGDGRRGRYFERYFVVVAVSVPPWDSVRWTGPRSCGEGGLGLGDRTTGPRHTGGRTYGSPVYVIGFTATTPARSPLEPLAVCGAFCSFPLFIIYFLFVFYLTVLYVFSYR